MASPNAWKDPGWRRRRLEGSGTTSPNAWKDPGMSSASAWPESAGGRPASGWERSWVW